MSILSPWCNRHGWLGVKNQLSIYLSMSILANSKSQQLVWWRDYRDSSHSWGTNNISIVKDRCCKSIRHASFWGFNAKLMCTDHVQHHNRPMDFHILAILRLTCLCDIHCLISIDPIAYQAVCDIKRMSECYVTCKVHVYAIILNKRIIMCCCLSVFFILHWCGFSSHSQSLFFTHRNLCIHLIILGLAGWLSG